MSTPNHMPDVTDVTPVAQGAMHEQQPPHGEFPKRGEHDILAGLHQSENPAEVTPAPEAMSEARNVSAIAFTSHPNAATGTYAYGYNDKYGVVTPYENSEVAMPLKLSELLQSRSLQYGRKALTDDGGIDRDVYGRTEVTSGEAFVFKGSFHGTLDNSDPSERRTIVSFAANNSRLSDRRPGTSCTFVVKGDHDYEEVLEIARKKFPGIMEPLEDPEQEGDSLYSGKPVDIHLANQEPIELGEQFNEPPRYRNTVSQRFSPESSVRMKINLLSSGLQSAYNIARLHNSALSDEQLADRVIQASRWRVESTANDAQLTPDSVDKLSEELRGILIIPDEDQEARNKWRTDRGLSYNTITEAQADEDRQDTSWKIDLKRNEAADNREGRWYKNVGSKLGLGKLFGFVGGKDKTPKPEAEVVALTDLFEDDEQPVVEVQNADTDDVSAVKVHTHKDRKPEPRGLKAFHRAMAALELKRTEMIIGSPVEKSHRRVRRILGAGALALVGVAGSYLAFRSGGPLHGFGTAVADKLGDTSVGHGFVPGANGELVPSTGGIGQQLPDNIPQTPSTHFGSDILPPSGGTGAVTPPDQIPGAPSTGNVPPTPTGVPTTPPQTPGHIPASPMGTPDQIPGTPQAPTPDVPKPGTGTFDPNAIGITTPDTNTLPAGDFHLNPGQTLSEYVRAQMPSASTNEVYNEVARVMQANNLPVNWGAPDPFEAARHIRPDMQLHT